jgi:hypothetical protein
MKRIFLPALLALIFFACDKPAGEGGTSTIHGRIWIRDFNTNFTQLQAEYWALEERVYIIYGGDTSEFYDDDIRTSFDGSYEFSYLRPGKYAIFAYSDDSTTITYPGGVYAVFREVEITGEDQTVEVPTMTLYR